MTQDPVSTGMQKELLLALESARMRFAVAIAAETKSTPLDRWQCYLDMSDRMCRFVRKLRGTELNVRPELQNCMRALEVLKRLPAQDKAMRLCQILGDIVTALE